MTQSTFEKVKISDFIREKMVVVSPETNLSEVHAEMKRFQIRHIPVVEKGEAVGIISDRDVQFVNHYPDGGNLKASDMMSTRPHSVSEDSNLREIIHKMEQKKIGSILIHNNRGKITGIFTSYDALKILSESLS